MSTYKTALPTPRLAALVLLAGCSSILAAPVFLDAPVGEPSSEQCFDTSECYLPGAKCVCCVKKYAYKVYSNETCFAYGGSTGLDASTVMASQAGRPCFDTSDCFYGNGSTCYCCSTEDADSYKELSDEYCFAYGAEYDAQASLPTQDVAPQDQGSCGSCWSFASTEQLSARVLLQPNGSLGSWGPVLSAEVPVAFYGTHNSALTGCDGGWPEDAGNVFKTYGVPEEQCAGYVSGSCDEKDPDAKDGCTTPNNYVEGTCYSDSSRSWYKWGAYSEGYITDVKVLSNEADIMADLKVNGPITTSFDVYDNFMSWSGVGVYKSTSGNMTGGHAVLITGYGDDDDGTPYWEVRNSWGASWGESGSFRFKRGANLANFEKNAVSYVLSHTNSKTQIASVQNRSVHAQGQRVGLKPGAWVEYPVDGSLAIAAGNAMQIHMNATFTLQRMQTQVVNGLNAKLHGHVPGTSRLVHASAQMASRKLSHDMASPDWKILSVVQI